MDYLSTDYPSGASEVCSKLLRGILDAPRMMILPFHMDDEMPYPTLILNDGHKVVVIVVAFEDSALAGMGKYSLKLTLELEVHGQGDKFIYVFENEAARWNLFSALSQPHVRDIGTERA